MKKLEPWEINDLADDFEEKGFLPTTYEEVTDFDEKDYGWIVTENGFGFINREGYLVIPDEYDQIWHPFFQNDLCIAKKDGKFGIFDRENNAVIPFIYDSIYANLSHKNSKIGLGLNGKYKIIYLDGTVILDLEEGKMHSFSDQYIIVSRNGKYGIIDYDQKIVLDFEWDHLEFLGENLSAGKAVDKYYNGKEIEKWDIHYNEYFKYFTPDFQKINFGVIDFQKNILFPFISSSPVREFNPESGRAKISFNWWDFPDLDIEELTFVADSKGEKIPFPTFVSEEKKEFNADFHKQCHELIWGKGTFPG